jgi:hypothetical protein
MKNYINILGLSICGLVTLISCHEDDYAEDTNDVYIGGGTFLTTQVISTFDTDVNLTLDLFRENDNIVFNSIEVLQRRDSITTNAELLNDNDSATFNSSFLGNLEEDDAFQINVLSTLSNGNTAQDFYTINVDSPISIDDENATEARLDTLSNVDLKYSTYTLDTPVDNVSLAIKKNSTGSYMGSGIADLDLKTGSVSLKDIDYNSLNLQAQDSLFYQFTVNSGSKIGNAESFIIITSEQ